MLLFRTLEINVGWLFPVTENEIGSDTAGYNFVKIFDPTGGRNFSRAYSRQYEGAAGGAVIAARRRVYADVALPLIMTAVVQYRIGRTTSCGRPGK